MATPGASTAQTEFDENDLEMLRTSAIEDRHHAAQASTTAGQVIEEPTVSTHTDAAEEAPANDASNSPVLSLAASTDTVVSDTPGPDTAHLGLALTSLSSETALTDPEQAPFRFLDLPLDIREQIYREVLTCNKFAKEEPSLMQDYPNFDFRPHPASSDEEAFTIIDHQISTGILLANREISTEARATMASINVFVRLTVVARHGLRDRFDWRMSDACVPILAWGRAARQCKSAAVELTFTHGQMGGTSCEDGPCDEYLVLACHLPMIADLMEKECRDEHDRKKVQELRITKGQGEQASPRALKHCLGMLKADLWCTQSLKVTGFWDDSLGPPPGKMGLIASHRKNDCDIEDLHRNKRMMDLANEYHLQGAYCLAILYFQRAAGRLGYDARWAPHIDAYYWWHGVDDEETNHLFDSMVFSIHSGIGAAMWELAKKTAFNDPVATNRAIGYMLEHDGESRTNLRHCYSIFKPDAAVIAQMRDRWMKADHLVHAMGVEYSIHGAPTWPW